MIGGQPLSNKTSFGRDADFPFSDVTECFYQMGGQPPSNKMVCVCVCVCVSVSVRVCVSVCVCVYVYV